MFGWLYMPAAAMFMPIGTCICIIMNCCGFIMPLPFATPIAFIAIIAGFIMKFGAWFMYEFAMADDVELKAVGSNAEDCGADIGPLMTGVLEAGIGLDPAVEPAMVEFNGLLLLLLIADLGMALVLGVVIPVDPNAPEAGRAGTELSSRINRRHHISIGGTHPLTGAGCCSLLELGWLGTVKGLQEERSRKLSTPSAQSWRWQGSSRRSLG
jgi:hypothetical protein